MSRQFDTAAGADSITFSVGSAPPDQGPITIAVLAKATSTAGWTGWMTRGLATATPIWGLLTTNNAGAKLFAENDFGNGVAGLSTGWRWYVVTKASGGASIPRFHVWDLSTTWAHTDDSAGVADGTGPITSIIVGGTGGGTNGWRGSIAAVATWTSALSDGAVQSACTLTAADLAAATPSWGVLLNQSSTGTSVSDFTGGGGNQTAISGTSIDADNPPGWSYNLGASASAALLLPPLSGAIAGNVFDTGSAALTLPPLAGSIAGNVFDAASAALSLPPLTAAAAGTVRGTGSAALTLPALRATITGTSAGAGPGVGSPNRIRTVTRPRRITTK